MKYKLTRSNLSKGLAVVLAGTMLFNGMKSCEKELRKYVEPNTASTTQYENEKTSEQTESLNLILEIRCKNLAKKYFKEELENIDIKSVVTEEYKNPIAISIKEVYNKKSLTEFLNELQEFCTICSLNIQNDTLAKLTKVNFDNVTSLMVYCTSSFIGYVDLNNFSNIKELELNNVNATNIPKSVQKITFNGEGHPQYLINSELSQISENENIYLLEFYNLENPEIRIPLSKNININFINCVGYTDLDIPESDYINIYNDSKETYENCIIINGRINEELNIVSNSNNVFINNLEGNPKSLITIKFPEGDYIREPLNTSYLERLGLSRKKY